MRALHKWKRKNGYSVMPPRSVAHNGQEIASPEAKHSKLMPPSAQRLKLNDTGGQIEKWANLPAGAALLS